MIKSFKEREEHQEQDGTKNKQTKIKAAQRT